MLCEPLQQLAESALREISHGPRFLTPRKTHWLPSRLAKHADLQPTTEPSAPVCWSSAGQSGLRSAGHDASWQSDDGVTATGMLKPSTSETSYQSASPSPLSVHSATVAGGTPVPASFEHSRPPLQPPVSQEVGPGLVLKSQAVRGQMRPAVQLSGTSKETSSPAPCSQLQNVLGRCSGRI